MVSESEGCYLKLKVERLEDELRERERVIEYVAEYLGSWRGILWGITSP